jgi:hypothetical protein
VAGRCESGNETAGSTKFGKFIDSLKSYWFLQKDSVPWRWPWRHICSKGSSKNTEIVTQYFEHRKRYGDDKEMCLILDLMALCVTNKTREIVT